MWTFLGIRTYCTLWSSYIILYTGYIVWIYHVISLLTNAAHVCIVNVDTKNMTLYTARNAGKCIGIHISRVTRQGCRLQKSDPPPLVLCQDRVLLLNAFFDFKGDSVWCFPKFLVYLA